MGNLTEASKAALESERTHGLFNVVRFYRSGRRKIVYRRVRLEIAQLHCRDPRTRKEGVWFDGYEKA